MDFKESKSIYVQLADRICEDILQGKLAEDERIPSVREFGVAMEVNVNTAMRAYDLLQSQEVIYNRRGIGYFVSKGAAAAILAVRRKMFVENELPEIFRQMDLLGITVDDIARLYSETLKTSRL